MRTFLNSYMNEVWPYFITWANGREADLRDEILDVLAELEVAGLLCRDRADYDVSYLCVQHKYPSRYVVFSLLPKFLGKQWHRTPSILKVSRRWKPVSSYLGHIGHIGLGGVDDLRISYPTFLGFSRVH